MNLIGIKRYAIGETYHHSQYSIPPVIEQSLLIDGRRARSAGIQ